MRLKKSIFGRLCLPVLLLWVCNAPAQSKEYQIKAAFLYNFAQFVNWPAATLADTNAPFYIGVLGDDPFNGALDGMVQGESIDNHKIVIERSQNVEDLKNCEMIFVSKSERKHVPEILSELDSRPILTVSEIKGFAERGGSINFYQEGTKLRFEINLGAAQHDGLKISAQLLSLGKIVQSTKEDK